MTVAPASSANSAAFLRLCTESAFIVHKGGGGSPSSSVSRRFLPLALAALHRRGPPAFSRRLPLFPESTFREGKTRPVTGIYNKRSIGEGVAQMSAKK